MANKNNKANRQKKEKSASASMEASQYEKKRSRIDNGARIMAIIVIVAMVVTTFLAAGLFIFD